MKSKVLNFKSLPWNSRLNLMIQNISNTDIYTNLAKFLENFHLNFHWKNLG